MSLQWASKVTKLSIKTQTNSSRNTQSSVDTLVQSKAERSQSQADWPRRGRPTNCHASTRRNHYRPPGVIKSVHEKEVQIWQRSPAGTLSCLEPIFRVEAKQLTYLREVHALALAPPWKSYKRTPTPPLQHTPKELSSLILSFKSRLGSLGVRVESNLSRDSGVVIGSRV